MKLQAAGGGAGGGGWGGQRGSGQTKQAAGSLEIAFNPGAVPGTPMPGRRGTCGDADLARARASRLSGGWVATLGHHIMPACSGTHRPRSASRPFKIWLDICWRSRLLVGPATLGLCEVQGGGACCSLAPLQQLLGRGTAARGGAWGPPRGNAGDLTLVPTRPTPAEAAQVLAWWPCTLSGGRSL